MPFCWRCWSPGPASVAGAAPKPSVTPSARRSAVESSGGSPCPVRRCRRRCPGPKGAGRDIRSIELTGGAIAIDGVPVTGAELKQRLGADADLIIQAFIPGCIRAARSLRTAPDTPGAAGRSSRPEIARSADTANTAHRSAVPRRGIAASDRVRIGGGVRVGPDEIVDGDVVAVGGGARRSKVRFAETSSRSAAASI